MSELNVGKFHIVWRLITLYSHHLCRNMCLCVCPCAGRSLSICNAIRSTLHCRNTRRTLSGSSFPSSWHYAPLAMRRLCHRAACRHLTGHSLLLAAIADHHSRIPNTSNPLSSNRRHLSYDVCREVRGEIIRTVLSCIVYWSCAQS